MLPSSAMPPASPPAASRPPFSLPEIAAVLAFTIVGSAIVLIAIRLATHVRRSDIADASGLTLLWLALAFYLVFAAALLTVAGRHRHARRTLQLVPVPPGGMRAVMLAIPIWVLGFVAVSLLTALLFNGGRPVPGNTEQVFRRPTGPAVLLLAIIVFAVLAPLCEEVFFRGMLYQYLRARLRAVAAAVAVSAGIFAAAHGVLLLFPIFFFMGCMLAVIFQASRSLYASIGFHAVNNAVAVLVVYAQLSSR